MPPQLSVALAIYLPLWQQIPVNIHDLHIFRQPWCIGHTDLSKPQTVCYLSYNQAIILYAFQEQFLHASQVCQFLPAMKTCRFYGKITHYWKACGLQVNKLTQTCQITLCTHFITGEQALHFDRFNIICGNMQFSQLKGMRLTQVRPYCCSL